MNHSDLTVRKDEWKWFIIDTVWFEWEKEIVRNNKERKKEKREEGTIEDYVRNLNFKTWHNISWIK